jgi:dynein intermediate chain 2
MDIQYVYTKKRSEFGRQVHFADRPVEIIADIQPNPELNREYVSRNPVELAIQNVREFSEHWVRFLNIFLLFNFFLLKI